MHIHDFHEVKRSSQDIWFYRQGGDKLSLKTVFLYQHSLLETDSYSLVEIHHIRIVVVDHNIAHEYHLKSKIRFVSYCLKYLDIHTYMCIIK